MPPCFQSVQLAIRTLRVVICIWPLCLCDCKRERCSSHCVTVTVVGQIASNSVVLHMQMITEIKENLGVSDKACGGSV